ncbi:putative transcription factor NAM family [Helianthus annuus]|nr:putative transcription factor NAM family [Helianthus annuus]
MESDKFYCLFKDRSAMLVDDDFQIFNRCTIHLVDEELIGYYLKWKVQGHEIEVEVILLVELSKCDPWELPGQTITVVDQRYGYDAGPNLKQLLDKPLNDHFNHFRGFVCLAQSFWKLLE